MGISRACAYPHLVPLDVHIVTLVNQFLVNEAGQIDAFEIQMYWLHVTCLSGSKVIHALHVFFTCILIT